MSIKLKSLLKEGYAWERKGTGAPLPTVAEVQAAYNAKMNLKENAKTYLMQDPAVNAKVNQVIATLKNIEVDGETMEYILHQVGMSDQMADQLVRNKQAHESKLTEKTGPEIAAEKDAVEADIKATTIKLNNLKKKKAEVGRQKPGIDTSSS